VCCRRTRSEGLSVSGFWRCCRELFQRRRVDRESVVELEQHVALAAADKVRAGVEEREARLDLFCAAMMGMLDVVRPVVDAYPGAIDWLGPHRIQLLPHAVAGEADDVADFLRSRGAASI